MLITGYLFSIIIGVSLGLIGGGGSILTVPVLVYIFHVSAVEATAYSLFVVGTTSAIGSVSYFRKGLVDLKIAALFGAPSIIAVLLTRKLLLPLIPEDVAQVGTIEITRGILLLLLFAGLMIAASYKMIKKSDAAAAGGENSKTNYIGFLWKGTIVGVLSGLVGAGGGFLIIPALVIFGKLPMKTAIGTSLVIIASNSLIGFFGTSNFATVNWQLILSVAGFAIAGIFIGTMLSKKIDGARLKPAFGWFVLIMGIYIIIRETLLK